MEVKYYTLSDFRQTLLLPFGEAVNLGCYEKMPYKQWRNLNSWSKDPEYEQMRVAREEIVKDKGTYRSYEYRWLVGPSNHNRTTPNPEVFDIDDNSFGNYLENTFIRNVIQGATISGDEIKSAIYSPIENMCEGLAIVAETSSKITANLDEIITDKINEYFNKEKENHEMKFGNFDFGPVDSSVHMSMYGMAIKNASGTYVAYDVKSKSIMDVDILNFEGANKFMYKMPVALNAVQIGDIIVHSKHPVFVTGIGVAENRLYVLDIYDGVEKTIAPTTSPFGFSFITKVVSLINFANGANASNPFGNMLPFLLMSDSKSDDNSMLMAMAMMGGHTNMMQNPMMLYILMNKDGKANDMLPFLLMGGCGFGAQPNGCNGNCSCHENNCDK